MLPAIWLAAALIGSLGADSTAARQAPSYSAASVVNSASNQANSYAPNSFVTIYGKNLAWTTRSLTAEDISGTQLPTILPGTGVRVWVGNVPAHMYFVSPTQINALLPADMRPGPAQLRVQVDATYGPAIPITIAKAAPALFQLDASTAIAAHADGRLITADDPARAAEQIVLWATGLGATMPHLSYGEIPTGAAIIEDLAGFEVSFDGANLDTHRVAYAGVAPGFGGLYQLNIQLPDNVGVDPEIRITASGVTSPEGVRIFVRPASGQ
jgi:uncharacterized protein (TIGR03437 family)